MSSLKINNKDLTDKTVSKWFNLIKEEFLSEKEKPEQDLSFAMNGEYFNSFLKGQPIEELTIPTSFGNIHAFRAHAEKFGARERNTIVAMHGDGKSSDNTGWIPVLKQFAQ